MDDETAATVTAVARPWLFVADTSAPGGRTSGDLLNLHALEINKAGDHRLYLAIQQSSFDKQPVLTSNPILKLIAGDSIFSLTALQESPRQLGLSKPLDSSMHRSSQWWFFPLTKDELAAIANSEALKASVELDQAPVAYVEFENRMREFAEFAKALQQ
jgi:hypothetical protein